jgi:hypothetical protein
MFCEPLVYLAASFPRETAMHNTCLKDEVHPDTHLCWGYRCCGSCRSALATMIEECLEEPRIGSMRYLQRINSDQAERMIGG